MISTRIQEKIVWAYLAQMILALDACHNRGGVEPTSSGGMVSSPSSTYGLDRFSPASTATSSRASSAYLSVPSTTFPSCSSSSSGFTASPSSTNGLLSAAGLAARAPVLHRDLKPENVFLTRGGLQLKLGDFGLSKELASHNMAQTFVGTPYYMSPELAAGASYGTKSDIWALGCIAYELCALAPPFDAQNQPELMRKIKAGRVPQLPRGYSQELNALVHQMLASKVSLSYLGASVCSGD